MNFAARIKFRHLQCFMEIARQGHLSRAAEALGVTQPAASKTLRELEETLGASLFDRSGRRMRLTPEGETFLRHAGASLAALRRGVDSLRGGGGRPRRIRAGVLPTAAGRVMPRAALNFARRAPDVLLSIHAGPNALLLERLRAGELDLMIGRLPEPDRMAGLTFQHLYDESIRAVVRAGHPLLGRPPEFARIAAYPMILPTPDSIIRADVERFLLANGLHSEGARLETVSLAAGRGLLRGSDAIWFISEGVVADELASGELAALPFEIGETAGAVGVTMRADHKPDAPLSDLVAALREAAMGLPGAPPPAPPCAAPRQAAAR
ncbi:pca operon transcription factor PcaQ [Oceanicella actignis]|uniref:LysR family transcriptional regulator, pca operon transcriptional activator n=1 Tax=Oceanicella actignis TaxID=1189325 RepID=A0A1M7TFZ8_9RHOB|nr:pca operon transcription factor PcaQ [Oceanicella actignis]SET60632.1 LysR family transcriptional regulator, pca operon transcriptional activator [Oceanicella actignis]SHN69640.1 LysR family transcriptional regulator, pca operon transcriptional activator [Oceanicella actignis]